MGMIEVRKGGKEDSAIVGNGEKVDSIEVGSIAGTITDKKGKEIAKAKLKNIIHTLASKFNLLSIVKIISKEWKVKGSKTHFIIEKQDTTITFDIIIRIQKGMLFYISMYWHTSELSNATINTSKDKAHRVLGYSSEEATLETACILELKLSRAICKCESYQSAKVK